MDLNLEFSFNQFGESATVCDNGDTLTTDGRYLSGNYSSGTVLTCNSDNNLLVIDSYSTSVGLNSKFLVPVGKISVSKSPNLIVVKSVDFSSKNASFSVVIVITSLN